MFQINNIFFVTSDLLQITRGIFFVKLSKKEWLPYATDRLR